MRIPVLAAPTASGKTALSLALATKLPIEIVSADAMMVYKEMNIGTAKPDAIELAIAPHHLIDLVEADQEFSVVDYVNLAEAKIAEILQRGNIPFVVGGTGFYIRGLSDGLPTTPKMDKDLQAELWAIFERDGLEPIQAELEKHSPSEAIRCQRNPRRVIRAVEIIRRTGKAPNEFKNTKASFEYNKIILLPNTEVLQKRIIMRTEKMFADGLVAEVEALIKKYPKLATARQAIGYKEIIEYLEGKCSLEAAKEQIIIATRQYAKRQRTWFKREKDAFVIEDISDSDKLLEVVLDRLEPEL